MALYYFPLLFALSLAGCIIGTYASAPTDEKTLIAFYRNVRPWGFWGPIHRKVVASIPDFQVNRNFRRDMFNVVVGTVWQTSLVLLPMYVVLLQLAGGGAGGRRYRADLRDSQEELVRSVGQGGRHRAGPAGSRRRGLGSRHGLSGRRCRSEYRAYGRRRPGDTSVEGDARVPANGWTQQALTTEGRCVFEERPMVSERSRMTRFLAGCVVLVALCLTCTAQGADKQGFENFVRRDGDVLKDGEREFRFISFNIPNLHYVEDDMRFDQSMPFRLPDAFEIDDALGTIEQMGGQVVRTYTLAVKKADDPADLPRYILGPGQFNEEAFKTLDQVIAAAHRHHVRLIIPFVDQWSWWGGTAELAAFRGKKPEEVWTDPQVIEDFKNIVTFVVNRVNTVTGVRYRDDKAILAWETGNELHSPPAWTRQIAAHIKSLDSQHLVLDGTHREVLLASSLEDSNIDLVQTHHYEKDPRSMIGHILESAKMAKGKKPYFVGEFGFLGTEALCAVMDTVRDQKLTGALLWSLRYRSSGRGLLLASRARRRGLLQGVPLARLSERREVSTSAG